MRHTARHRFESRAFLMAGIFADPMTVLAYEQQAIAKAKQCKTTAELADALKEMRELIRTHVRLVLERRGLLALSK